jgi:hypothetical protein
MKKSKFIEEQIAYWRSPFRISSNSKPAVGQSVFEVSPWSDGTRRRSTCPRIGSGPSTLITTSERLL